MPRRTVLIEREPVSLIKLLPAWLHAVADYAVGALVIIVALVAGHSAAATATGVVVGAVVLAVSMLTRYPLGVVKVLPFTVHSAGDYAAAALLGLAPFALRFNSSQPGLSAFYVAAGVAVLAVSLITNYQYADAAPAPALEEVREVAAAPKRRPRPLTAAK